MAPPTREPLAGPERDSDDGRQAGVRCRLAAVDELARIAAFMRRAAGVDIPERYLRWRYFDNPAGPSGIVIAHDGDQIVGLMSAFAVPFRLGGRRLLASQMGHNDVLRSHRGASVYFQLGAAVFRELVDQRGIDFCFGVAVKETRDLSLVMMGFDEVGPIGKLVKIVNPVPHLRKKWKLPLPRGLGRPAAAALRRAARRALSGFGVSRFDRFSDLDGGGWPEAYPGHLMSSRDAAYMDWRYVECPLQNYERLQLRSGSDLLGWVVFHAFEEQGVRYGVLDECFSPREDVLGTLVHVGISGCLAQAVDAVVAWAAPSTALNRALKQHGFASRPAPRSLIVRRIGDGIGEPQLAAEESWYYTIGDTEYWLFPVAPGFPGA